MMFIITVGESLSNIDEIIPAPTREDVDRQIKYLVQYKHTDPVRIRVWSELRVGIELETKVTKIDYISSKPKIRPLKKRTEKRPFGRKKLEAHLKRVKKNLDVEDE